MRRSRQRHSPKNLFSPKILISNICCPSIKNLTSCLDHLGRHFNLTYLLAAKRSGTCPCPCGHRKNTGAVTGVVATLKRGSPSLKPSLPKPKSARVVTERTSS